MQLASRFAYRSPVLRSNNPLSDDQIRTVAPSIFADTPHESRSERYSYIPTAAVLTELRKEGFQPFMVCQTRVRQEDRRDYTKHMLRFRHASQINGAEANEIILLNSHDGTSSYQMLAGMSPLQPFYGRFQARADTPDDYSPTRPRPLPSLERLRRCGKYSAHCRRPLVESLDDRRYIRNSPCRPETDVVLACNCRHSKDMPLCLQLDISLSMGLC